MQSKKYSTQYFVDSAKVATTRLDEFSRDEMLINVILSDMGYTVIRTMDTTEDNSSSNSRKIVFNELGENDPEKNYFARTKSSSLIKNFWDVFGSEYCHMHFKGKARLAKNIIFERYLNSDLFDILLEFNSNWDEEELEERENFKTVRNIALEIWKRVIFNLKSVFESEDYVKKCIEDTITKNYLVLEARVPWNYNFRLFSKYTFVITNISSETWRVSCIPYSPKYASDVKIKIPKEWKRLAPKGIVDVDYNLTWCDCESKEKAIETVNLLMGV